MAKAAGCPRTPNAIGPAQYGVRESHSFEPGWLFERASPGSFVVHTIARVLGRSRCLFYLTRTSVEPCLPLPCHLSQGRSSSISFGAFRRSIVSAPPPFTHTQNTLLSGTPFLAAVAVDHDGVWFSANHFAYLRTARRSLTVRRKQRLRRNPAQFRRASFCATAPTDGKRYPVSPLDDTTAGKRNRHPPIPLLLANGNGRSASRTSKVIVVASIPTSFTAPRPCPR